MNRNSDASHLWRREYARLTRENPGLFGVISGRVERVVRLDPGETKNRESRVIPLAGELLEMLKMQKAIRDQQCPSCPWVFFRAGKPIKDFRGA